MNQIQKSKFKIIQIVTLFPMDRIHYAPYRFQAFGEAEIQAVMECLKDGWLSCGERTRQFECRIAALMGKKRALFVNSGSSANYIACNLFVKSDDEVIVPGLSFPTMVGPIFQLGAIPKYIDVMPDGFVPSVDEVMAALTKRTRAIFLSNTFGQKPDWERIVTCVNSIRSDVAFIEDSCDMLAKTECTDISTTSFYASHVITAGGGGGMVCMNNEDDATRATQLRDWGRLAEEDYTRRFDIKVDGIDYDGCSTYVALGMNLRSTEMNAAFGLANLERLEGNLEARRAHIHTYIDNIIDFDHVKLPKDAESTDWLALPVMVSPDHCHSLAQFLEEHGIQTRRCFGGNITRQPFINKRCDLPVSDSIMRNGILLGCHQGLETGDVATICAAIKQFFDKGK